MLLHGVKGPLLFGPDSSLTLVLSLLLALGAIAGAVYFLGRRRRALYAVLSFFSSLMLIVACGVVMNRNLGYASKWEDVPVIFGLGGQKTSAVPVQTPIFRVGQAPPIDRHEGDASWDASFSEENATLRKTVFTGPVSGISLPVWVWTSPDYKADPSNPAQVIVMLHGYPGNPKKIAAQLKLDDYREELANTIVVFPSLQVDSRSPDCVDLQGRPQVGTWVTRDITEMIAHNFPEVSTDRKDWVLSGASAGGYCALALGLTHPHLYQRVIAFSGYDDPETGMLRYTKAKIRDEFKISALAQKQKEWDQKLYLTGTQGDGSSLDLVEKMEDVPLNISATTLLGEGGHNWKVWAGQMPDVLAWLEKT